MKNNNIGTRVTLLIASFVFPLSSRSFAAEAILLPTAQEISTAKLTSAIESGRIPTQGVLMFVVCTDAADGSPPVVVLDTPQHLAGSASDKISFVNKDAGSSFKGSLDAIANHKDTKRLNGAYSIVTGRSANQLTPMNTMDFSAHCNISQGGLTMIGSGQSSVVDSATGKRTNSSVYVFAYYK